MENRVGSGRRLLNVIDHTLGEYGDSAAVDDSPGVAHVVGDLHADGRVVAVGRIDLVDAERVSKRPLDLGQ